MRRAAAQETLLLLVRSHKALRPGELAQELGYSSSDVSHCVRRLCEAGYALSLPCDHDKRGRLVSPTAEGRAHIAAILGVVVQ